MILANKNGSELQITISGSEGEYVSIMQSLVMGIIHIPENEDKNDDARKCLGHLLIAMLPGEENIILKKSNNNNHE